MTVGRVMVSNVNNAELIKDIYNKSDIVDKESMVDGYKFIFKVKNISKDITFGIDTDRAPLTILYSQGKDPEKLLKTFYYHSFYSKSSTTTESFVFFSNDIFFTVYSQSRSSNPQSLNGVFKDPYDDDKFFIFSYRFNKDSSDVVKNQGQTSLITYEDDEIKILKTHEILTGVSDYITEDDKYILGNIYIYHPIEKEYIPIPKLNTISRSDKRMQIVNETLYTGNHVGFQGDYSSSNSCTLVVNIDKKGDDLDVIQI